MTVQRMNKNENLMTIQIAKCMRNNIVNYREQCLLYQQFMGTDYTEKTVTCLLKCQLVLNY